MYKTRVKAGMDKVAAAYNYPELRQVGETATPEMVGLSAKRARVAKEQAGFAQQIEVNFGKEREDLKKIEKARLSIISGGLSDDAKIQGDIRAAEGKERRYDATLSELDKKNEQDKNLVDRVHAKKEEGIIASFKRKLEMVMLGLDGKEKVAQAKHQAAVDGLNKRIDRESDPSRISALQAEKERIRRVMRGEDDSFRSSPVLKQKGANGRTNTGGFFANLFSFGGGNS